MTILLTILFIIIALFSLFIILGMIRTWQVQHSSNQTKFLQGGISHSSPDGFYKGYAKAYTGPWIGKKFDRKSKTGTNVFIVAKKEIHRFNFITSVGKGIQDTNIDVLKIEYNIPKNSFFLRMILDEIIEIEPNKYLGKVHIRFSPYLRFTLGYFWLEK